MTQTWEKLRTMKYTGRGIVQGISLDGTEVVQIYWITGRSRSSQARILGIQGSVVFVKPYGIIDMIPQQDPSFLFYNALSHVGTSFIAGNGPHTDLIHAELLRHEVRVDISAITKAAPPARVDTPRILGLITLHPLSDRAIDSTLLFGLVKPISAQGDVASITWAYENLIPGKGYCLTTYCGSGGDLVPFSGEPFSVPLDQDRSGLLHFVWSALNPEYRVCLVVRTISILRRTFSLSICDRWNGRSSDELEFSFDG